MRLFQTVFWQLLCSRSALLLIPRWPIQAYTRFLALSSKEITVVATSALFPAIPGCFQPLFLADLFSSRVSPSFRPYPYNLFPGLTTFQRSELIFRRQKQPFFSDSVNGLCFFFRDLRLQNSDFTRCLFELIIFGYQKLREFGCSSHMITSEPSTGSSNYLAWASSVELWCKGHGVQDRLTNNSCVVNEKAKASKMQNPKHNGRRLALNYVISYGDLLIPS